MPLNPGNFHPGGPPASGGGGIIVPIGPGPLLPNVNDDVKSIVSYVIANGCDGSDRLRALVTLFQVSINALIAQNNQVHGLNEPLLPVDGTLAGKTESAVASYASGMGLKFTTCAAIVVPKTGGVGPGPQQPGGTTPATSSNTAIYVGVGVLALVGVVALVMASGGKKRGKRRNPIQGNRVRVVHGPKGWDVIADGRVEGRYKSQDAAMNVAHVLRRRLS